MASSGQTGTHPPQPLQAVALMAAISRPARLVIPIAAYGHASRHFPQAVQASVATVATSGSSSAKPLRRIAALWVTAARPDATLSDEDFGPWQAPAISTPPTTVSTGRSFGWISLKKPSEPSGSLRTPISSSFLRGTMPVSYTHLRAHETDSYLVCRLLLEKKKK